MRIMTEFLTIPGEGRSMRAFFAAPHTSEQVPGLLFYSDIFQLTPSTLRMATRFAGYGFAVLAPEIYYRRVPAGTAWAFDDAGRVEGMAAAKATSTAEFDNDRDYALAALTERPIVDIARIGVVGFCLGGHLAFRAAFSPKVRASVCYYPTGLHNGALGSDADNGSLQEAGSRIQGALHLIFGTEDPHVPADARRHVEDHLKATKISLEISHYPAEHAFMRDEGPRYDPELTDLAFAAGIATLRGQR